MRTIFILISAMLCMASALEAQFVTPPPFGWGAVNGIMTAGPGTGAIPQAAVAGFGAIFIVDFVSQMSMLDDDGNFKGMPASGYEPLMFRFIDFGNQERQRHPEYSYTSKGRDYVNRQSEFHNHGGIRYNVYDLPGTYRNPD